MLRGELKRDDTRTVPLLRDWLPDSQRLLVGIGQGGTMGHRDWPV